VPSEACETAAAETAATAETATAEAAETARIGRLRSKGRHGNCRSSETEDHFA
jgi:plasmid stabilization system protein ParE